MRVHQFMYDTNGGRSVSAVFMSRFHIVGSLVVWALVNAIELEMWLTTWICVITVMMVIHSIELSERLILCNIGLAI